MSADDPKNARRRQGQTIRERARRKAAKGDVSAEIELLYKPLDQWTDEEIARGKLKGPDGTFRGGRPSWMTTAIQEERRRRLRQLMTYELGTMAADALRTIQAVMLDPETSGKDKLSAATYLVDQFMGKATTTVDVGQVGALENFLADVLVNPDGELSHGMVVEGVVEDLSYREDDEQSPYTHLEDQ
jgi:hypothetical protein